MAAADACSAADLFELLWLTLIDAVGPAATAMLLQRSIKLAAARGAAVDGLVIRRDQFEYAYTMPPSWRGESGAPLAALRDLAAELVPLLVELTGSVVVRQLSEVGDLVRCGIVEARR